MKTFEEIEEIISENQLYIKNKYHIKTIGIFGFYIRGEQTENSDVDILVEFEPGYRFGLFTFCNLENYLTELVGIKVDLVMKEGLKPKIGQRILAEVIYL